MDWVSEEFVAAVVLTSTRVTLSWLPLGTTDTVTVLPVYCWSEQKLTGVELTKMLFEAGGNTDMRY